MKFLAKLFYDIPTYAKCLKWGKTKTIFYLLLIAFITATSAYVTIYNPIKKAYFENIGELKTQLANIKIVNGKIQPYSGNELSIKDTTGETFAIISPKVIDVHKTKNLIFSIEGKRLSIYQSGEEMSFNLDSFDFGNASNFAETIPSWNDVQFIIMPFVVFMISLSITIWHSLMLGTFAFIIDIPHKRLRTFNSIKMAIVASTPAAIIALIYALIFKQMLPDYIVMIISTAMLYFVVINLIKKFR